MCGSMTDIQSATAEIRRGKEIERKKEERKPQDENIVVALLHRAAIIKLTSLKHCVIEAKSHVQNSKNHFVTYSMMHHYEYSTINSLHKVLVNLQASNMDATLERIFNKLRAMRCLSSCLSH